MTEETNVADTITDTFTDAQGRCYIAGVEVHRAVYDRHEEAWARVEELEAACSELTTENLRLDAERAQLARELLTAAQHERSRLATADHQRELANRWLDLARSALPAPPTAAEMAGSFAVKKDDDYYADKARYGD